MAKYLDITDWNEKPFFNTKGTRNKCIVCNPSENIDYYFKTSMNKEGKNYKTEFWSEIIASEVGRLLGFNILEYNVAKHGEEVGCISQSMNTSEESLIEGMGLLTGYDNTYKPEEKNSYSAYTFQFIKKALNSLGQSISPIINTIIFDSLIGNSDRHQENWGFIMSYSQNEATASEDQEQKLASSTKIKKRSRFKFYSSIKEKSNTNNSEQKHTIEAAYSPIYDSGCCLAREKSEEDVRKMLKDEIMFESFINRGKAEIRWGENGNKLNHFELIRNIQQEHPNEIKEEINRVIQQFDLNKIQNIVFNIDRELPEAEKKMFGLSEERKELICRLIEGRFNRLKEIIQ